MADETKNDDFVESVHVGVPSNSSPTPPPPPPSPPSLSPSPTPLELPAPPAPAPAAAAAAQPSSSSALPPSAAESETMSVSSCCCNNGLACCSTRLLLQNYSNFNRSGPLMRIMLAKDNGGWEDFSGEVLSTLKSAFVERKPVIDVAIDDLNYLFDFTRMLQMDFESGSRRSIAWIDEKGNCFFPRVFVTPENNNCFEEEIPEARIENLVGDSNNKRMSIEGMEKDVVEVGEVDPSRRPWQREMDASKRLCSRVANVGPSRWPHTKLLKESDASYSLYRNSFISGMKKADPRVTITAVHECCFDGGVQNSRIVIFKMQLEITRALRGSSNTLYAWHGASAKTIASILAYGFGAPTTVPEADLHGVGVYLSPLGLPHTSAKLAEEDDNGERHLMLCRVVLGNTEPVEAGSLQSIASDVNFDTGVDDTKNPKWFVFWTSIMNRHIIPECIVSFRTSHSGQDRPTTEVGSTSTAGPSSSNVACQDK